MLWNSSGLWKLVIMCGCTPLSWPITTPRNCITCGQDIVKRLTDSTYQIQLSSNPRKCLVVHFDHLKPYNIGAQTAAVENPSAPESTNPPPVDSSLTRAIQDPLPLVQGWKWWNQQMFLMLDSSINHHTNSLFQLAPVSVTPQGIDFLQIAKEI